MKKTYLYAMMAATMLSLGSCSGFLDTKPDTILTEDQTYGDPVLTKSVLANFYDRINHGQNIEDWDAWTVLDEVVFFDGSDLGSYDRNKWRVYDYGLIRDINKFIVGVTNSSVVTDDLKKAYIGEARFIRAWHYFCTARVLGGMPLIGDEVFNYTSGMDITTLQKPRSTEEEIYNYVISECKEAADMLTKDTNKNNARGNYWTCKMLEARAAITAASLATYNTPAKHPNLRTAGGEVGIDASKASGFYTTALNAAKELINDGPYRLMKSNDRSHAALVNNFYKAVCIKDGNSEVIWTRDYISPGKTNGFTQNNLPMSISQDTGPSRLSVLLNLVEAYEPLDAADDQLGTSVPFEVGTAENPKFFATTTELFEARDPRLMGTVIVPGAEFGGAIVDLQAGQLQPEGAGWKEVTGARNTWDVDGRLITHNNGPFGGNERNINRTGFFPRKYLDAAPAAGTIGRGSEMWNVRFRIAEAYLIAAEAEWELSRDNNDPEALGYINEVRDRAGVKALKTIDHNKIMHEYRVELAFEGERWWNLKRWMEADNIWTGENSTRTSNRLCLWPYKVVAPGNPNDGKWAFIEKDLQQLDLWRRPLRCTDEHYYGTIDNDWINKNPKLVKNPFQ